MATCRRRGYVRYIWIEDHNQTCAGMSTFTMTSCREFDGLDEAVQDELLAHIAVLETFGPPLGRPRGDTLKGSRHAIIKELRFDASDGVWRFAFAFDPKTQRHRFVWGDKSGGSEKRFYRQLIAKAEVAESPNQEPVILSGIAALDGDTVAGAHRS
jgi:hypothetical protein